MQSIFVQLDMLLIKYKTLPLALQQSFFPYVVTSLPLIIASLFSAYFLMPFIVLVTSYLLYMVTTHTDTYIFTLTKMQSRTRITIPMVFIISLWGLALAAFSRKEMMLGIVGPFIAILLLCTAPAYRMIASRDKRRIPLEVSFTILTIFAFLASLNYLTQTL